MFQRDVSKNDTPTPQQQVIPNEFNLGQRSKTPIGKIENSLFTCSLYYQIPLRSLIIKGFYLASWALYGSKNTVFLGNTLLHSQATFVIPTFQCHTQVGMLLGYSLVAQHTCLGGVKSEKRKSVALSNIVKRNNRTLVPEFFGKIGLSGTILAYAVQESCQVVVLPRKTLV